MQAKARRSVGEVSGKYFVKNRFNIFNKSNWICGRILKFQFVPIEDEILRFDAKRNMFTHKAVPSGFPARILNIFAQS